MTKKSQARLDRDAVNKDPAFAETPPWDSLNEVYNAQTAMLNNIEHQVGTFFQIEGVAQLIPDDQLPQVKVQIAALGKEIVFFRNELAKVNATHKDKSGKLAAGEQLVDVLRASEAYTNLGIRIDSILTPIYHYLLSIMAVVEKKSVEIANQPAEAAEAQAA